MAKKYYIAYGSNLNLRQMRLRCPGAKPLGTAALDGWRLLFKGSRTGAYLTVEPQEGSSVPAAVWEITEEDERSLDRYEGYPVFYSKRVLPVTFTGIVTGKRRKRNAVIYIMREDSLPGIPSDAYVRTCAEGYRDFGFDSAYLRGALELSRRCIENEN